MQEQETKYLIGYIRENGGTMLSLQPLSEDTLKEKNYINSQEVRCKLPVNMDVFEASVIIFRILQYPEGVPEMSAKSLETSRWWLGLPS